MLLYLHDIMMNLRNSFIRLCAIIGVYANGIAADADGVVSMAAASNKNRPLFVQMFKQNCLAAAALPLWIFVQMADTCTLYRGDEGALYIESSKFHEDTECFTELGLGLGEMEKVQPTSEFFNNFDELFDYGGMPNAALTIMDDDLSQDFVVSVFVAQWYSMEGEGDEATTYGYKLEQYPRQKVKFSLEDLMNGEDSVTFDRCSMFIE